MWNMNDINVAKERTEDIRRAAEKRNAIARMRAAGQTRQPDQPSGQQSDDKQKQKLWERVRNSLR